MSEVTRITPNFGQRTPVGHYSSTNDNVTLAAWGWLPHMWALRQCYFCGMPEVVWFQRCWRRRRHFAMHPTDMHICEVTTENFPNKDRLRMTTERIRWKRTFSTIAMIAHMQHSIWTNIVRKTQNVASGHSQRLQWMQEHDFVWCLLHMHTVHSRCTESICYIICDICDIIMCEVHVPIEFCTNFATNANNTVGFQFDGLSRDVEFQIDFLDGNMILCMFFGGEFLLRKSQKLNVAQCNAFYRCSRLVHNCLWKMQRVHFAPITETIDRIQWEIAWGGAHSIIHHPISTKFTQIRVLLHSNCALWNISHVFDQLVWTVRYIFKFKNFALLPIRWPHS